MTCTDSFMDIARCARAKLYSAMGKIPESVEIVPVRENIEVDKALNTYLTIYKGMTKKNDYRKEKIVARFSRRCWSVLLRLESKQQGGNFSRSNEFNSYSFRWLSATMPEEEIYNNLVALDNGEVDVKTLIKRHNYKLCKKSVKTDKSIEKTEEFTSLIEEKNNLVLQYEELKKELSTEKAQARQQSKLNKALEKELQRTQKLISEEHARMQSIRIACRESKDCTAKLEKVTRDNKLTIDELRKSLHNVIDERNSLRRRLEEQCSKNSQLMESSAKQIEDHKVELSRLKKSFIHEETDNSMDTIDQRKKQVGRAEDTDDQSRKEFGRAEVPSPTDQVETYSCWICQEELSSHALLVEHYDNHMK
ncbi:hypothetical protein ACROYT_G024444 [Oculina patagonica]